MQQITEQTTGTFDVVNRQTGHVVGIVTIAQGVFLGFTPAVLPTVMQSDEQSTEQAAPVMQSDEEMEAEYQREVARLMTRGYSEQWAKENASWNIHVRHGGD